MTGASLRKKLYLQIDPRARNIEGLSAFNKIVVLVVLGTSLLAVLHTEPAIAQRLGDEFLSFELAAGIFFTVEYLLRLWTAPEKPGSTSSLQARLRFIASPLALLDLAIILSIFSPLLFEEAAILRVFRVLRILALTRLTRFSIALRFLLEAVYERRYDLAITLGFAFFLMLAGATALYWIEGSIQPEAFGSIPRALWWAVITLTTVGYGDVAPITPEGKIVAGLVALAGIALVALPTGILAAAFSDSMQRRREALNSTDGAE